MFNITTNKSTLQPLLSFELGDIWKVDTNVLLSTPQDCPIEQLVLVAPGTSDSSIVFSTPQSWALTQEAGNGDGGDMPKVGLFVVKEVPVVCGGTIGGGGGRKEGSLRFCT